MNWFRNIPKWVLAVMLFGVSGSFIFWGIPSVFSFSGVNPLIHVGETKIYTQDFQNHYERYLKERSEQERRQISSEEGRQRDLDYAARDRLVQRLLIQQKAHEMGLVVSRDQVIDELRKIPQITDAKGNITPEGLQRLLQNAQMSEGALIAQIQGDMIQQQLVNTMLSNLRLPPEMLTALQRYRLERRVAEYVLIDPSRAGQIPDPSDAELKKYYEAHIDQFTAPELRALTVMTASAKELAALIEISDADLKAAYDRNKARYVTPEKRKIEQIRFPDEAKARAASDQIKAGKSFEEVAKAAGFKPEDIQLGDVPAGDTTVPAEAFTLELNKPSEPLKGLFGWVIVRATSSTPGTVKPLEEVKQELHDALATEKAKDQVTDLANKYEDDRGGGSTIEEAAGKLKLKVTKIAAIDGTGKSDAGQTVDLPVGGDFLSRSFAAESGGDGSGLQENQDGVYYEFRVDSIKPSAKKPFATVRNDVLTMWRTEQQRKKLQAFADGLVKRGNSGETMAQIASQLGVAALKSDPLPRLPGTAVFSQAALNSLFDAKIGGFFSGPVSDGKSIVVARVDSTMQQAETPGSPESGMYAEILNQAFAGDMGTQFTAALRRDTCSRMTIWERLFGTSLKDCVDEEQFKRVHAGE